MVDKIDRTEAPPPYFITRPKDAKESQHQQSQQREEKEQRRQRDEAEKGWAKFDRRERSIRPLRARRDQISSCIFRAVSLHSGLGILQVNVLWKDGRRTNGALVLVRRLEEYMKLRHLRAGQEVPEEYWARDGMVEFGIVESAPAAPAPREPSSAEPERAPPAARDGSWLASLGITRGQGSRVRWALVAAGAVLAAAAALMFALLG